VKGDVSEGAAAATRLNGTGNGNRQDIHSNQQACRVPNTSRMQRSREPHPRNCSYTAWYVHSVDA
jgi:hypothetical protein